MTVKKTEGKQTEPVNDSLVILSSRSGDITEVTDYKKFKKGKITKEFRKENLNNIIDVIMKNLYPISNTYDIVVADTVDITSDGYIDSLINAKNSTGDDLYYNIDISTYSHDETNEFKVRHQKDIIKKIRKLLTSLLKNSVPSLLENQNIDMNIHVLNEICSLSIYNVEFIVLTNEISFTNKLTNTTFKTPICGMSIHNTIDADGKLISKDTITILI